MSKSDPVSSKKERNKTIRWVITIFFVTILISGIISLGSDEIIVGVAVTSAEEKPFHSMAARKVPGAMESIRLLRNAERVSSICNDVVGDICGVVSGSASATIAAQVLANYEFSWPRMVTLVMSALVAGFTVGGKAVGKTFAIGSCTKIVTLVGKFLYFLHHLKDIFKKK